MPTTSPLAVIEQERSQFRDPDLFTKLCTWLRDDLMRARLTRFEQKGRQPISLASTFVDIDSAPDPNATTGKDIVADLFDRSPSDFGRRPRLGIDDPRVPQSKFGVLLIGGPGQGKSTVTQYLAQRHRAATLEQVRERLDEKERTTLDELDAQPSAGPELPAIREYCLPARVVLPSLAAWMVKHGVDASIAVFEYLRHLIATANQENNGQAPAPDDLDRLLGLVPWLFVFDGLDEITAPAEHEQALRAILAFVDRLRERSARALVVATTRPQTYRDQLADAFETRHLLPLSKERGLQYAVVLLRLFFEDDRDHQEHVLRELETVYQDQETARLMASPLQVSIMTELIDEIGQPPRQRWRLFSDYQGIIIARERKRPHAHAVLRNHLAYVEDILRHLGLLLQVMGESGGRAEALLSGDELEQLIAERLAGEDFSEVKRNELARELRKVAVDRLVFLVELRKDAYGFELRPLQEFMAAAALTHGNEQHIEARLTAIANSAAWRNVFLFAASKCFSSDGLYLRDVLVNLCEALDDPQVDPLSAELHGGGAVALAILRDGSVQGPRYEALLARRALGLLQVPTNELHEQLGQVGGSLDVLLEEELTQRWPEDPSAAMSYWVVLVVLCERNLAWALEFFDLKWPIGQGDQLRIVHTVSGTVGYYSNWLIERIDPSLDRLAPRDGWMFSSFRGTRVFVEIAGQDAESDGHTVDIVPMEPWVGDERVRMAVESTTNPAWRPMQVALCFADAPSKDSLAWALREIAHIGRRDDLRFWAARLPWPISSFLASVDKPADLGPIADAVNAGQYGDVADWREREEKWRTSAISAETFLGTFASWPHLGLLAWPDELFGACEALNPDLVDALIADPQLSATSAGTVLQQRLAWLKYDAGIENGEAEILPPAEFVQLVRRALGSGGLLFDFTHTSITELHSHLTRRSPEEAAEILIDLSPYLDDDDWIPPPIAAEHLRRLQHVFINHPRHDAVRHILATALPHSSSEFVFPIDMLPAPPSDDESAQFNHIILLLNCATSIDETITYIQALTELPRATFPLSAIFYFTIRRLLAKRIFADPAAQHALYRALSAKRDQVTHLFRSVLTERSTGLHDSATWYRLGLSAPTPATLTPRVTDPAKTRPHPQSPDTAAGHLNRITVTNLRVFEHLELPIPTPSDDGQWLIFVGENGVGKSTLLRAIVLALAETEVAQQLVANSRSPLLRSNQREGSVAVELGSIEHLRTIAIDRKAEKLHNKTPNGPDRPPLFAYGCARGSAAAGEDAPPDYVPVNDVLTLFDDRARLTPAKSWLISLFAQAESHGGRDAEVYDTVIATLVNLLDGVEKIEVDGEGPWFTGQQVGVRVPLASLSDGYITTIGWVVDLLARWVHWTKQRGYTLEPNFNTTMQGIVLVDEIDLHLHPRWQLDVIAAFRKLFPRMTFVVTTHNPLTLLSARTGEIFVLRRDDSGVVQVRQRDLPPGIRADQVLTGEWFGLVSTRDPDTLRLLEEHARHLRDRVPAGDPERIKVEDELRRRLRDFPNTSLEQLVRPATAEEDDAPPLDAEQRELAKRKLDTLVRQYVKSED